MSLFHKCNHDWELIQEVTTESKAELQGRLTGKVSTTSYEDAYQKLYQCKHITILKCNNCGKLKLLVENQND